MRKNKKLLFALGGVLVVLVVSITLLILWDRVGLSSNKEMDENSFTKMDIRLQNVDLETIESDKDTEFVGNEVVVIDDGKETSYSDVGIKGHGNSTWRKDKKPFQLKFKHKTNLFGLANVKKWLLLANRFDASQLRNDAAFYFARMINMEYAINGKFLELSIDGDYRGLYYIVPKITINKNSVDLRSSLGILVEADNLHGKEKGCYYSNHGVCLTMKDTVDEDNGVLVMKQFVADFSKFEIAAEKKNYEEVAELVDIESFVKYYLLNEFTVNPDAYTTSWYMYKDGADDKIHAGPGWDYDYALGNREWFWASSEDFYSPELDMIRKADAIGEDLVVDGEVVKRDPDYSISRIMIWLMDMPQFREEVKKVFRNTLLGRKMELLTHIKVQAMKIRPALSRDSGRWGQVEYEAEIEYLLNWVDRRFEHFEETYGNGEGNNVQFQ